MMKKNIAILAVSIASTFVFGQCKISVSKVPTANETVVFSVDTKAQCNECYSWKSSNEDILKIEGNKKLDKVTVSALKPGKSIISVSIFTEYGLIQCDKDIVINGTQQLQETRSNNECGINTNNFKEVKVSENIISFFPNGTTGFTYLWTVEYSNGEKKESREKIPQFPYWEQNLITSVKLDVLHDKQLCSVSLVKKYDAEHWKPAPSAPAVQQRAYTQGSYNDYINQ